MQQRYYDPIAGRFLSVDPVTTDEDTGAGFNRYEYANSNPYRYVDPDGRQDCSNECMRMRALSDKFSGISESTGGGGDSTSVSPAQAHLAEVHRRGVEIAQTAAAGIQYIYEEIVLTVLTGAAAKSVAILNAFSKAVKGVGTAAKGSSDAIQITKSGVALPPGAKHQIPEGYLQNPHRAGSYGEVVDGKFKERLRIDPPTPAGQKGPNYTHYHRDGKGKHFSPRPGDKDPGFGP